MNIDTIKRSARGYVNSAVQHKSFEEQDGEEGGRERWYFLGSVQGITPSGKIYTPWANSNVSSCPRCKGTGYVENKAGNEEAYNLLIQASNAARMDAVKVYGMAFDGKWPKALKEKLAARDKEAEKICPLKTCGHCDGVGSREAYEDQVFQEALDKAAQKKGGWITSGEGSMDDIFLVIPVES